MSSPLPTATALNTEWARFKICVSAHRLIVSFKFLAQIAWVKFFGYASADWSDPRGLLQALVVEAELGRLSWPYAQSSVRPAPGARHSQLNWTRSPKHDANE
jgi:hypothetical protein